MSKHHDRSKSGGFFDTIFTRSTKKYGNGQSSTQNTRPNSEHELNDIQTLHNGIQNATPDEINKQFLAILEDMNIPKDKRQPLITKTQAEKKEMIFMHLKGENRVPSIIIILINKEVYTGKSV
jgi:diaphanous